MAKRKTKTPEDYMRATYCLLTQHVSMGKRLLNGISLERKEVNRTIHILDAVGRFDRLTDTEKAHYQQAAKELKNTLQLLRDARPLMT